MMMSQIMATIWAVQKGSSAANGFVSEVCSISFCEQTNVHIKRTEAIFEMCKYFALNFK